MFDPEGNEYSSWDRQGWIVLTPVSYDKDLGKLSYGKWQAYGGTPMVSMSGVSLKIMYK